MTCRHDWPMRRSENIVAGDSRDSNGSPLNVLCPTPGDVASSLPLTCANRISAPVTVGTTSRRLPPGAYPPSTAAVVGTVGIAAK